MVSFAEKGPKEDLCIASVDRTVKYHIFVVLVALQLYSSSYRRHPLAPLPYFVYQLTLAFFFRTHQIYWCWLLASGVFLKVCVPCTSTLFPGRWLLLYNYSATALENENDSRST